jgi:hypothetical protein
MNAVTSLSQVQPDQNQVDGLDADEGHDEAAEAVDQQVAAQDGGRRPGRGSATPFSASGISATMISALKITADRIADWPASPGPSR